MCHNPDTALSKQDATRQSGSFVSRKAVFVNNYSCLLMTNTKKSNQLQNSEPLLLSESLHGMADCMYLFDTQATGPAHALRALLTHCPKNHDHGMTLSRTCGRVSTTPRW